MCHTPSMAITHGSRTSPGPTKIRLNPSGPACRCQCRPSASRPGAVPAIEEIVAAGGANHKWRLDPFLALPIGQAFTGSMLGAHDLAGGLPGGLLHAGAP